MNKPILDACCGSKMFHFHKNNENVLFLDNRKLRTVLCDERKLVIEPDIVGDFTDLPFENESFSLVIFDPPHLVRAGKSSWLRAKYGVLPYDWEDMLGKGFKECWRVLKKHGTLVFKWNEYQIPLKEVLKLAPTKPLIGNQRPKTSKTHWIVFFKE